MAISPQRLTIYLYSAHRAVIFVIAQLSCFLKLCRLVRFINHHSPTPIDWLVGMFCIQREAYHGKPTWSRCHLPGLTACRAYTALSATRRPNFHCAQRVPLEPSETEAWDNAFPSCVRVNHGGWSMELSWSIVSAHRSDTLLTDALIHLGPHSRNFLGQSCEDFLSYHRKIFSKALISNYEIVRQ